MPTRNRHACVARLVRYYRSIDFTGQVYFGGDKNSFGNTNQFNFTPQERVRYRFIDCGAKDTLDSLYQIASEALRSKIEYCTYHGDDDFLTSEVLNECVDFLANNKEFVSAR